MTHASGFSSGVSRGLMLFQLSLSACWQVVALQRPLVEMRVWSPLLSRHLSLYPQEKFGHFQAYLIIQPSSEA